MDSGLGDMAMLHEDVAKDLEEKGVEIFKVDDIVNMKGSLFKIHQVLKDFIVLKLLSRAEIKEKYLDRLTGELPKREN